MRLPSLLDAPARAPRPARSGSPPPCITAATTGAGWRASRRRARRPACRCSPSTMRSTTRPAQRDLQDILTCIREGVTIERGRPPARGQCRAPSEAAGRDGAAVPRRARGDRRDAASSRRASISRSSELQLRISRRAGAAGLDAAGLARGADLAARRHALSGRHSGEGRRSCSSEELALIGKLDYARYFLTIHDIVRFAEDKGILCQGRGSAANSAVCYVLGITAVDPAEHDLLFARFISKERTRAARHRRRFRARAARGGHPVYLRAIRPRIAPASPRRSSTTGRAAPSAKSARRSA